MPKQSTIEQKQERLRYLQVNEPKNPEIEKLQKEIDYFNFGVK